MIQKVNKVYAPLFTEDWWRYAILLGGRSAGRSTVASQYALAKLIAPEYYRCAIMRFVLGDIRNSIYQEIVDRAEEQEIYDQLLVREQQLLLGYDQNRINGVGFRKSSSDQKSKLKSLASYNCVIIEEADEVSEEDFLQLDDSLRTVKGDIKVILLLNPPDKNHWIVRRWLNLVESDAEGFYYPQLKNDWKHNTLFIHTNYEDNLANIAETSRANFQHYETVNPEHYHNMIRGLISEGRRGRIFTTWQPIPDAEFDELPYPSYYGLDFGYSADPTALIEIKEHNNKLWLRELVYETGLLTQHIAEKFEVLVRDKGAEIYGDSQERRLIEELRRDYGWNVIPSLKGADSIRAGIKKLQGYEVYYTESSTNIAYEHEEYRWALDINKVPTNKPIDEHNHAIDAIRYGVHTRSSAPRLGFV